MDTLENYDCFSEEELEEFQETISSLDILSATNALNDFLKQQDRVELNIGVTGESGSGKSTFVNAFRGLGDKDKGSAKTGVVETTTEPEVYPHPEYDNVKVWDLPGIGTPNFKANEYLKLVQFERYDFFIIIALKRFRECHTQLAKEIMRMGKKFYFVRSHTDQDIVAEKRRGNLEQKYILDTIREDCRNGLRGTGIEDPVVFLISGWELGKYDFDLLQERMEKELPQHKKNVLMLALPNITREINEKKKKTLEKDIIRVAVMSALVATVPVPGLSFAVDLAIVVMQIVKYCKVFGIDKRSLKQLCKISGKSIETLESLMKSLWHKGVCTSTILPILQKSSFIMTEDAVESALRLIPLLGSVVAGGISFWAVSKLLKKALNDIAEDASIVLIASVLVAE